MAGLHIVLAVLLGPVSCSHGQMFGSVVEVPVKPGDNITLYCDCKLATGVYIVWYRNSYNENQPAVIMRTQERRKYSSDDSNYLMSISNFPFVRNSSSNSYDLLIINFTASDEGLYYCGTEDTKVVDNGQITTTTIYNYGNITRLICNSRSDEDIHQSDCSSCWKQLFSLCPTFSVLSAILSSLLVYYLNQEKDEKPQDVGKDTRDQDEGVCYAAVGIHQALNRLNMKKGQISVCTYSVINTSRG